MKQMTQIQDIINEAEKELEGINEDLIKGNKNMQEAFKYNLIFNYVFKNHTKINPCKLNMSGSILNDLYNFLNNKEGISEIDNYIEEKMKERGWTCEK